MKSGESILQASDSFAELLLGSSIAQSEAVRVAESGTRNEAHVRGHHDIVTEVVCVVDNGMPVSFAEIRADIGENVKCAVGVVGFYAGYFQNHGNNDIAAFPESFAHGIGGFQTGRKCHGTGFLTE